MKKQILFALLMLVLPVTAFADEKADKKKPAYISTSAGFSIGTGDYTNGFVGTVALGGHFGDGWRAEVEYGYRAIGYQKRTGDGLERKETETQSFMINGYRNMDTGHWLSPYLGLGIGTTKQKAINGSAGFAYQAMVGTTIESKLISTDLGFRYFSNNDISTGGLYANLRYRF